jgi:hypothetical protein
MYRAYVETELLEWELIATLDNYLDAFSFSRALYDGDCCWKVVYGDNHTVMGG